MLKKIFLPALCLLCLFCAACAPAQPQTGAEYTYSQLSFKRGKGVNMEDLASFVPAAAVLSDGKLPQSVEEFENFLLENAETYSFIRQTKRGAERVFLKTEIVSVTLSESVLTVKTQDGETDYTYTKEGNRYVTDTDFAFYFEKGEFRYDLAFTENFSAVYHYSI